jgi:hypothetical protein
MRLIILSLILLLGCTAQQEETNGMEEKLGEIEEKVETIEEDVEQLEEKLEELEGEIEELKNGVVEVEEEEISEPAKGTTRFLVTVQNVHDSQNLSPGVFVVHKPPASINYFGKLAPPELEPLVEYGNHTEFKEYVEGLDDVLAVYTIDEPILPGENKSFIMDVSTYMPRESYLSGIQMATGSNDGYAMVSNIALFSVGNGPKSSTTNAQNYDAGTEQNKQLLSGFEGGQPDPSQGSENVDNGIPTDPQQPVIIHTQLTKTIMKVTVVPK